MRVSTGAMGGKISAFLGGNSFGTKSSKGKAAFAPMTPARPARASGLTESALAAHTAGTTLPSVAEE